MPHDVIPVSFEKRQWECYPSNFYTEMEFSKSTGRGLPRGVGGENFKGRKKVKIDVFKNGQKFYISIIGSWNLFHPKCEALYLRRKHIFWTDKTTCKLVDFKSKFM